MNVLLTALIKSIGNGITKVVVLALKAAKSFFDYKKSKIELEKEKKEKEEQEKHEQKIDNIVDNGSIEDLLDLKR